MTTQNLPASESDKQEAEFMLAEYATLRELRLSLNALGENRVNFYMAAISGSLVGLALINQLPTYPEIIYFIDGAVLVMLFLFGLMTFARMVERSIDIITYTRGMNRIRRYFVRKYPGIEQYLSLSTDVDRPSFDVKVINLRKGRLGLTGLAPMVGVINSIIATVGVVILTKVIFASAIVWALLAGALTFMLLNVAHYRYLANRMKKAKSSTEIHSPLQSKGR